MMDTAGVALEIWRNALSPLVRKNWAKGQGLSEPTQGILVAFLAGCHDLGKASSSFQSRLETPVPPLRAIGFTFPRCEPVLHGLITGMALRDLLKETGLAAEVAEAFAYAVAGHHGSFPTASDLDIPLALGDELWQQARRQLFRRLAQELGAGEVLASLARSSSVPPSVVVQLAGATSVADWIASSTSLYPHQGQVPDPSVYWRSTAGSADQALRRLMWAQPGHRAAKKTFADLFGFTPRPVQEQVVSLVDKLRPPALVVVEASTGEGKTEASLYIADRLAADHGQTGLYFALPTQATSNQMFTRLARFLPAAYEGAYLNLQLLHGHASLSAELEQLLRNAAAFIQPMGVGAPGEYTNYDGAPPAVVAGEWFTQRKRGLLAPFGVGTVDQALLAVLNTRHFFVRLWGLAGKIVVVDEVHAYDAYMLGLIEALLQWLASLGCSVVILSATLPEKRRLALMESFRKGIGGHGVATVASKAPYPRVSWVSPGGSGAVRVPVKEDRMRRVGIRHFRTASLPEEDSNDVPSWAIELERVLRAGGCAAVVCNTVGRAQKTYQILKSLFPEPDAGDGTPELDLFHAHFVFEDRAQREERALRRFGKVSEPSVHRPRRAVLVATQVIEQSLDLDFDLMVTELAPVDLLIQRAGRSWRHGETPRPTSLGSPNVWLLEPDEDDQGLPHFPQGWTFVYDEHILLRSWLAMRDREAIVVPDEVEGLVEEVYGDLASELEVLPPALAEALTRTRDRLKSEMTNLTRCSRENAVSLPRLSEELFEQRRAVEEDRPDIHLSLQALTRLDGPTVRAVVLWGDEDQAYLDEGRTQRLDLRSLPEGPMVRRLLQNSLSVSHRGLVPVLVKDGLNPASWRKSPHLRHHRVLFLDAQRTAAVGQWRVTLDSDLGLAAQRR